jgi:3-phosphoshikimate 1-carboxyvinyltransferase
MPSAEWAAPVAEGPIDATVVLPGSKSLTNRYLVLAALGRDVSRLRRPLRSRDTRLMVGALQALGVDITDVDGTDWLITPGDLTGPASIDCGLAGNVMRFVPPLAGLALGEVHFDGDAHARRRPMAPILTALRAVGGECRGHRVPRPPLHDRWSGGRPRRNGHD